jgi:hypothetical protein
MNTGNSSIPGMDLSGSKVDLNEKVEWGEPYFKGQFNGNRGVKTLNGKVRVVDLANESDLEFYNELRCLSEEEDPSVAITEHERRWCDQTGNWKVYLRYEDVLYARPVKKESGDTKTQPNQEQ